MVFPGIDTLFGLFMFPLFAPQPFLHVVKKRLAGRSASFLHQGRGGGKL